MRKLPSLRRLGTAAVLLMATAGGSACLPRSAGPLLSHFEVESPAPGSPAPDFSLPDPDGGRVRLSDVWAERPLVLWLGSESCPVFRARRHWMGRLVRDYGDRVHFLAIYTTEAHPVGSPSPFTGEEWDLWVNRLAGVRVSAARSLPERLAQARAAREALSLPMRVVVDRMDDAAWRAYGAASSPTFVIDRDGRVLLRQVWTDPGPLRRALAALLKAEESPRDRARAPAGRNGRMR